MAQVTILTAGTQATSLSQAVDWFLMHRTGNADANRVLLRDLLNPLNITLDAAIQPTDTFVYGDASDATGKVKRALRRDVLDAATLSAKTVPVAADSVMIADSADATNKVKKVTYTNITRFQTFTTAGRPSAVTLGAGARIYDTTLAIPIWSDGAVWRDALGTAV